MNLLVQLREQKLALSREKQLLNRRLKNEQRKRQRLKTKAKNLSNEDLVQILGEREAAALAKARAEAKAKAKSRSHG